MKKEEVSQGKASVLSEQYRKDFYDSCKRGIYKELHKRGLITDVQLNYLLGRIE